MRSRYAPVLFPYRQCSKRCQPHAPGFRLEHPDSISSLFENITQIKSDDLLAGKHKFI
ncbi:MAG: hypothetical protein OP8BY_1230 [Candidatus Saccharicenans subterraneus]|uniref:Uncharacterized protein n=1 Tax=Candidatus Saccharicenans subterraneus TaxID=2508984 RepID=A0A3E2BPP8_9BACT|nr:MAG: hypothetical protein OP8BY_1230 [Candidatus Saccharicenans subterraneum]